MIIIAHVVSHFHYDTETCFISCAESSFLDVAGPHNGFHKFSFIDQTNHFMGNRSENATSCHITWNQSQLSSDALL